jgi:hypothetical protein
MNAYFAAAGGLTFLLGVAHSVLGELFLIRRLASDHLPPVAPFSLVEVRNMGLAGSGDLARRTLRFTWHIATVLGWTFAAILLRLALPSSPGPDREFVARATALSFCACSLLALFCTRGKHPAWVACLAIATFIWLGGA